MKRTLITVLFLVITVLFIAGTYWINDTRQEIRSHRAPIAAQREEVGIPHTLNIPAIGVEAKIEQVGLDSEERMDVPSEAQNVAWYKLGYYPGQVGSAVISGHLDQSNGQPAVFWQLHKLEKGDEIVVTDSIGKKHTFYVTGKKVYATLDVPLYDIFTASDKERLNIITCEGDFVNGSYDRRLVIYSEAREVKE